MRFQRYALRTLLAAVALTGLAACDSGSSPDSPMGVSAPTAQPPVQSAIAPGWSSPNKADLIAKYNEELARTAARKDSSELVLASLRTPTSVLGGGLLGGLLGGVGGVVGGVVNTLDPALVQCTPGTYASDTRIIGPAGGDLQIGPNTLHIPRGALTQYTVITGEAPVSSLVEVDFQPQGLRFLSPAQLKLDYSRCTQPHLLPYSITYVTDLGSILEWLLSSDDYVHKVVYGNIRHFSRWAMASR